MRQSQVLQVAAGDEIRPMLEAYRANVELVEVTPDNYIKVRITGACVACHGAHQRIAEMMEAAFKENVCSGIKGVILLKAPGNHLAEQTLNFLDQDMKKRCRYAVSTR